MTKNYLCNIMYALFLILYLINFKFVSHLSIFYKFINYVFNSCKIGFFITVSFFPIDNTILFCFTIFFYDKYFVYQQLDFTAELYQCFYSSSGERTGSAYLVSERKRKQICIYCKRIIRKPSDAILYVVHDRCVAICTIGRHYKKYAIEIRSIGMRRDAFNSFLSRHGGKGTRCWNIILHGNLCSRAEMKNILIVCFFAQRMRIQIFLAHNNCVW